MRGLTRKAISIALVLMMLVAAMPAWAETGDLTDDQINSLAFSVFLRSKLEGLSVEEIKKLIDLIEKIDQKDIIVDKLFETALDSRLNGYGITRDSVTDFAKSLRDDKFQNKSWKEWTKEIAEKVKEPGINSLTQDQINWIKHLDNDIFDKKFPGLTALINTKFNNKFDFIRFNRQVFEKVITKNIDISYEGGRFSVSFKDSLKDDLNLYLSGQPAAVSGYFKKGQSIVPLNEQEIEALEDVITDIITAFNDSEFTTSEKDLIAKALESFGFDVKGYPVTPPEPGDDGSSGGTGGGGGGGGAAPSEPEIEIPKDQNKPVAVIVPADAVKVTVADGKAVVTFDEKAVSDLLKLLDEAVKKAEGKKLALIIDLTGSEKIGDKATVELPASLAAKAFEKGATLTVNLKKIGIDLPAGSVEVGNNALKINVEAKDAKSALMNIKGIENMRPVGSAVEANVLLGDNPASFKKKVTLRLSIKGLTTNIDKLGIYYLNEKEGRAEFKGGKVDKASGEIRANLAHLSTYVLLEYDRTFGDIKSHWAKNYVESMAAKHVVDGRTADKFVPNDNVTRAEFAKLVVGALELDLVKYKGSFEDVASGAWYADYIQTAYDNGLITGRVEGKVFDPNAKITRQEIMAIIGRALARKPSKDAGTLLAPFKDAAEIAGYAKEHVALLVEMGIVSGYPDGTVRPQAHTTRAEAVKLIYGLYNN
ncbi:S-layer homology domain-containing protein [Thermosediminibacter oceani]|uniref:S-layer domain protein n=1 Tax=Thermosediminibacter oceani (strain ATCC BAA-1034 / DSM 16646 / JW/IW-1228P) TaxID=555079 RepID=D9S1J6_THEOJ|nr:S-layer homology domain-containing protein [Thermosediminibacter oceani]ADL07273.1 S-layer domain protein [Thermosediminibacter oceani DSM 16646]